MSEQHPAGWYPTADRTQERWFDGTVWTDHVRPGPAAPQQAPAQPVPQPAADPYGAFETVAEPTPAYQPQPAASPATSPAVVHQPAYDNAAPGPSDAADPSAIFDSPAYGSQPYQQQAGHQAEHQGGFPPPPAASAYAYQPPAYGQAAASDYAHWIKRVGAWFIDYLITVPFYIVGMVIAVRSVRTVVDPSTGITYSEGMSSGGLIGMAVCYLIAAALVIWNLWIRQGRTGYSLGKQALGIRLVKDATGEPPGIGTSIGRFFCHILDGMVFYLGYLWPLWDAKRQTFADKIVSTVVVNQRKNG